jgi:hypothetical protein
LISKYLKNDGKSLLKRSRLRIRRSPVRVGLGAPIILRGYGIDAVASFSLVSM